MSDKVTLTIDLTPEEHQRIELLAQEHGYDTLGEYLLSLVEDDDDEPNKAQLLEELREGMQAAIKGETIPASKLWDALNSDD
jgi:hypothetical protein